MARAKKQTAPVRLGEVSQVEAILAAIHTVESSEELDAVIERFNLIDVIEHVIDDRFSDAEASRIEAVIAEANERLIPVIRTGDEQGDSSRESSESPRDEPNGEGVEENPSVAAILDDLKSVMTRHDLEAIMTAYGLEKLKEGDPDARFNKGEYAAIQDAYDDRCYYFREHEPETSSPPSPGTSARRETSTRVIYEPLTDGQLIESATKQNALISEAASLTGEMKAAASDYKQRIAALESEASRLGYEITVRRRKVEVETEEVRDYDSAQVITVRTDTGARLSARAMTLKERQRPLPAA